MSNTTGRAAAHRIGRTLVINDPGPHPASQQPKSDRQIRRLEYGAVIITRRVHCSSRYRAAPASTMQAAASTTVRRCVAGVQSTVTTKSKKYTVHTGSYAHSTVNPTVHCISTYILAGPGAPVCKHFRRQRSASIAGRSVGICQKYPVLHGHASWAGIRANAVDFYLSGWRKPPWQILAESSLTFAV
jgi:hypothetical protein